MGSPVLVAAVNGIHRGMNVSVCKKDSAQCDEEKQSLHRQICYYCLLSESTLQNSAILSFSKLEYKCGKMSKGSFICTETKEKSDTTYAAEATSYANKAAE